MKIFIVIGLRLLSRISRFQIAYNGSHLNEYLFVYLSNESPQDVYFDDLSAKHFTGPLLQEQSYYPFGTEMHGISSKAFGKLESRYKFNGGVELEESIEMYTTFYRQYDQQLGRFNGVDVLSEQNAIMSVYSFANNNPAMFSDPLGDMASSDNPNTAGDIIQHITNMLNFGLTKTDHMFAFGENNALVWDFATLGKDGEAGISFGFNMGGIGSSSVSDQTVEEIVRSYVKEGKYNSAVNKILKSYPDVFKGNPKMGWLEDYGEEKVDGFKTNNTTGLIRWSRFVFDKFADKTPQKDGQLLWTFAELTRSMYHEFVHYYQSQGLYGYALSQGEDDRPEREVVAHYDMYTIRGLPEASWYSRSDRYMAGLRFYDQLPSEKQAQYSNMAGHMALYVMYPFIQNPFRIY